MASSLRMVWYSLLRVCQPTFHRRTNFTPLFWGRTAADILRDKMDASEYKDYIFGMLFIKRCSDVFEQRYETILSRELARGRTTEEAVKRAEDPDRYRTENAFYVPACARWKYIHENLHEKVGDGLNTALGQLEDYNDILDGVVQHISFTRKVGQTSISNPKLRELIDHFNKLRLRNDDFEFPDLLGAAYEYMIAEFADQSGKKGGQFYTPRDVVRLMVRLIKPQPNLRIYDPCCGSGGMLILSKEYVEEHTGDSQNLSLYGQESNGGAWAICKMNMLLHGITDANIQNDDVLKNPRHQESGELMRFDRVIANPPFSQDYSRTDMELASTRFKYGYTPTKGKADLMFAQHMLSVLRPKGIMATVMPHGVLFRGGDEGKIREKLILNDHLEAVIGLPPNLFYNTGIPACILIMRREGEKPAVRKGKVLFINADAEFFAGRAQNYLRPEHIEKIVSTYDAFREIDGFAAIVTNEHLATERYNCNIRRYADNTPPSEPQDVRAHVLGGVPRAEVESKHPIFQVHGFDPDALFTPRDDSYLDFKPGFAHRKHFKEAVESHPSVKAQEDHLARILDQQWQKLEPQLISLPGTSGLMHVRAAFLEAFATNLVPVGLLDRFKADGVVATWWNAVHFNLRVIAAQGYGGLVDGWVQNMEAALKDEKENTKVRLQSMIWGDSLVRLLLPDHLRSVSAAEAKVNQLAAELSALQPKKEKDDEDSEQGEEEELELVTVEEQVGRQAEIKRLKQELIAARKALKTLQGRLIDKLKDERQQLDDLAIQPLVLSILREELQSILERYIAEHRRLVIAALENLWDKYQVPMTTIQSNRLESEQYLDGHLKGLGYF